jgi:hypothetical protein
LEVLTSRQLSEWEAYDRIDPTGEWREDFRMAYLASLVTNLTISVHGKKGAKHTEVTDFMPDWSGEKLHEPKKQSAEEMKEMLLGIAAAQNKKVAQDKRVSKVPVTKQRKTRGK